MNLPPPVLPLRRHEPALVWTPIAGPLRSV